MSCNWFHLQNHRHQKSLQWSTDKMYQRKFDSHWPIRRVGIWRMEFNWIQFNSILTQIEIWLTLANLKRNMKKHMKALFVTLWADIFLSPLFFANSKLISSAKSSTTSILYDSHWPIQRGIWRNRRRTPWGTTTQWEACLEASSKSCKTIILFKRFFHSSRIHHSSTHV